MWDDTGIEGSLSSSINSTATSPDLKIPHCIFLFQILHLQPFGNVSSTFYHAVSGLEYILRLYNLSLLID